jgi:hypothetical protein
MLPPRLEISPREPAEGAGARPIREHALRAREAKAHGDLCVPVVAAPELTLYDQAP